VQLEQLSKSRFCLQLSQRGPRNSPPGQENWSGDLNLRLVSDLSSKSRRDHRDLDYMHARHNSPLTGRFLAVDPAGARPRAPQTWNRYLYAAGNPLLFIDPNGETIELGHDNLKAAADYGKKNSKLFEALYNAVDKATNIRVRFEVVPDSGRSNTRGAEQKITYFKSKSSGYVIFQDGSVSFQFSSSKDAGLIAHELAHLFQTWFLGINPRDAAKSKMEGFWQNNLNHFESQFAKDVEEQVRLDFVIIGSPDPFAEHYVDFFDNSFGILAGPVTIDGTYFDVTFGRK
jgi:RHS repeat-associated protein